MATTFAGMLSGVSGAELVSQWEAPPPLWDAIGRFAPRPVLVVAAGDDPIFPMAAYAEPIRRYPHVACVEQSDSDHSCSACRPWLVTTVCDWLVATVNR